MSGFEMPENEMAPSPKKSPSKFIWIILIFIIVGIVASVAGKGSSSNTANTAFSGSSNVTANQSDTPTPVPTAKWYPNAYHEFSDGIAWRWATNSETTCRYSTGSCWSVMVISRDGCTSGIYAELAILDSAKVQIDFTNDTSTNVPPMQKVKLTFDTFNDAAKSARLSTLNCNG
jgi:hypothetical protein